MTGGSGKVAVIGAGIVGVAAAIWLARDGREVVLIDRLGPGEGTSYGNAGLLASSSIVPVTLPGLLGKAPKMLLDRDSPLFLRWSYLPRLLPWLARYLSHCRPEEGHRIAGALAHIIGDSVEQHQALAQGTGAKKWISPSDYLFVYRDRAAFEADGFGWALRRENGFSWEELEDAAFRDYDPGIGPGSRFGVRLPNHGFILDPGRYVKDLAAHLESLGGSLLTAEVQDFTVADGKLTGLQTSAGRVDCAAAVVTSGAWSGPLMRKLGLKVPLESERGYHVEFENPSITLRSPCMIAAGKFVATPMAGRLRCAGVVEFGGLDAPPSRAPFDLLRKRALEAFPGLTWSGTREWMGHRPSTTDSLPVIGRAPGLPEVLMGFGHQHIGLTGGPKTGRIIAGLLADRRPNFDLAPYLPDRFA